MGFPENCVANLLLASRQSAVKFEQKILYLNKRKMSTNFGAICVDKWISLKFLLYFCIFLTFFEFFVYTNSD